MARFKFIDEIADATAQAVREMSVGDESCYRDYPYRQCIIEVELTGSSCDVSAVDENGRNCENVEAAITAEIISRGIKADFDENLFVDDNADSNLDPAFASWQDYYNYKFG